MTRERNTKDKGIKKDASRNVYVDRLSLSPLRVPSVLFRRRNHETSFNLIFKSRRNLKNEIIIRYQFPWRLEQFWSISILNQYETGRRRKNAKKRIKVHGRSPKSRQIADLKHLQHRRRSPQKGCKPGGAKVMCWVKLQKITRSWLQGHIKSVGTLAQARRKPILKISFIKAQSWAGS